MEPPLALLQLLVLFLPADRQRLLTTLFDPNPHNANSDEGSDGTSLGWAPHNRDTTATKDILTAPSSLRQQMLSIVLNTVTYTLC